MAIQSTTKQSLLSTLVITTIGAAVVTGAVSLILWKINEKKSRDSGGETRTAKAGNRQDEGIDPKLLQLFQLATHDSKELTSISNTEKLILYSLYKQSTEGDAPEKDTNFMLNFVEKAKFSAWARHRGMPRGQAMVMYIDGVQQLMQKGSLEVDVIDDLDDIDDRGGGFGNRPSTMMAPEEEENGEDGKDLTPGQKLLHAAGQNDIDQLEKLLSEDPKLYDYRDADGQTALHFACDQGAAEALMVLLEAGANGNAADADGISVLQAAVIADNFQACKVLLEHGADPDIADTDGYTPRSCAKDDGSEDMKKLFADFKRA